ncbi:RnhB Ribonuclease HII [Rhabdaerophilaceae bacterium]
MPEIWPCLPPAATTALHLAGIDEVGRGPLAGPVVAAAVILPNDFPADQLADSKLLVPKRRAELAALLERHSQIGLCALPAPEIDRLNIRQATLLAMKRAVAALGIAPDFALVDGKDVPEGLACQASALIKGDSRIAAISAASIVAKVMRDRMMAEAEAIYPGYGFDRHKGYPAPQHLAALRAMGLTPLHRLSYAPCRALSQA